MTETPGASPSTEDAPAAPPIADFVTEPEPGEVAAPEAAPGANDAPEGAKLPVGPDGLLTEDGFVEVFNFTFAAGGDMTGLQTLKLAHEQVTADPAARALYQTCKQVSWMHWLLRPETGLLQRLGVIGMFGYAVTRGCMMEIAARRVPAPGNDNLDAAPVADGAPEAKSGDVLS